MANNTWQAFYYLLKTRLNLLHLRCYSKRAMLINWPFSSAAIAVLVAPMPPEVGLPPVVHRFATA